MKKYSQEFFIGTMVGLLGGIMGNIMVTAMYRAIDGVPIGSNWQTFILGLIGFALVLYILYTRTKK